MNVARKYVQKLYEELSEEVNIMAELQERSPILVKSIERKDYSLQKSMLIKMNRGGKMLFLQTRPK